MAMRSGADHPGYLHGESHKTKEWKAWNSMHRRCRYPSEKSYPRYGGRGIIVCERWGEYVNFLADVGRSPTAEHQIDRIDNDGNYSPDNVKWSTRSEQIRNSTKARYLEYDGKRMTIGDWSKHLGINRQTLQMRLDKYGYTVAQALSTPIRQKPLEVRHRYY